MNAACTGRAHAAQNHEAVQSTANFRANRHSGDHDPSTPELGELGLRVHTKGQDVFFVEIRLAGEESARQDRGAHPLHALLRQRA